MPFTALASTSGEEGGSDGESNDSNDGDNGGGDDGDGGNDDESPDPPVVDEEPSDAVPAEELDNDDDNQDDPLPYCDTPEGEAAQSCHDKDDYDEVTGLYPCNDGSQKANPNDCPDATEPVIGNNNPILRKTISFGTFSVQGSVGPAEQTGPIPVPKAGEALLKIIYEGEWSGSILDSGSDSASYDGTGNYAIVFPCSDGGIYSSSVQKSEDGNDLMHLIVQDSTNTTLDQGQTTAEFGIVSLSGGC